MFPLSMILTIIIDFNCRDLHLERKGRKGQEGLQTGITSLYSQFMMCNLRMVTKPTKAVGCSDIYA